MSWTAEAQATMGPRVTWVALAAVGLGIVAFASGLFGGGAPRAYAALIASWLFFAGAAAGAVAFRAFFRMIDAGWARPLAPLAGAEASFLPAASVLLVVIMAGAGIAPWAGQSTGWLATPFLVLRQLALNAALFGFAYLGFRQPAGGKSPTLRASVVYLLVFAVVLSIWAFDFVVGPAPDWVGNTLIGPYLFVGAFIAGAGVATLVAVARGALSERQRLDAGSLLLTLAIFWAYLFWSQYLTLWYANLPDEIVFALRRSVDNWGWVVVAVVVLVFVVPFLGLLHPYGRRSPGVLRAVLVAQLVGLWLNCNLLVVPSLSAPGSPPLGWRDFLIALGMLGAFALSTAPRMSRELAT